jgi:hypothetical protein
MAVLWDLAFAKWGVRYGFFFEDSCRIASSQEEVTILFLARTLFFLHGQDKRHPRFCDEQLLACGSDDQYTAVIE